jgi:hypothetical protein
MNGYDFIHDTLGDEPDPTAREWLRDGFVQPQRRYTAGIVLGGVVCIGSIVAATYLPAASVATTILFYLALALAIYCFVKLYKLRNSFAREMPVVMDREVDPALYARRYLAYVAETRQSDALGVCWNYARALRWCGRRDDAERLMAAYLARHGKRVAEKVLCHATFAYCAFDAQDAERLDEEVAFLDGLGDRGFNRMMHDTREQLHGYAAALGAMADRATWPDAYAVFEGYFEQGTPLQKVHFAYLLAQCSPGKNERSRWITYASSHAGSTWIGRAARALGK